MASFFEHFWPHIVGLLTTLLALVASANAVLYKRDTRAAISWVGLIWLVPIIGALLYALLGINRIQRKATELRQQRPSLQPDTSASRCDRTTLFAALSPDNRHFTGLVEVVDKATVSPLTVGNRLQPLVSGDNAYPAMLAAIDEARVSLVLATYIFDNDPIGREFVAALAAAVQRGVQVRVLIDGVGVRYSLPSILRPLRRHGITVACFLSSLRPWRMPYLNLRNHRKLLIIDGYMGFTGGMNIRNGHRLAQQPRHPVQDLHFRVEGPVVAQMMATFAEDWAFTTGETLTGDVWFPPQRAAGRVLARGIAAGPDEDVGKLRWTLLGAINQARHTIRIVTPYFLPDHVLITAIVLAALRGVKVDIVLPATNNLPYIHWAATAQFWQFLKYDGCRILLTPPPFDHTKLMLVDGIWAFMGSANWDQRSLRLNFEFNVECYDRELVADLNRLVDSKLAGARVLTLTEVDGRPLAVKLRDSVARLFSPYL